MQNKKPKEIEVNCFDLQRYRTPDTALPPVTSLLSDA